MLRSKKSVKRKANAKKTPTYYATSISWMAGKAAEWSEGGHILGAGVYPIRDEWHGNVSFFLFGELCLAVTLVHTLYLLCAVLHELFRPKRPFQRQISSDCIGGVAELPWIISAYCPLQALYFRVRVSYKTCMLTDLYVQSVSKRGKTLHLPGIAGALPAIEHHQWFEGVQMKCYVLNFPSFFIHSPGTNRNNLYIW